MPRPRHAELRYPGTCRTGLHGKAARAWRLRTEGAAIHWQDRAAGPQAQDVQDAVGDFVLLRADGCFAYQLAVVVDDADQGISHVVRGADLLDNTARQIWLQQSLQLPMPQYLHTALVLGGNGEKLSKQNGAQALDTTEPLHALNQAAATLGLPAQSGSVDHALTAWTAAWASAWVRKHCQAGNEEGLSPPLR
jgi:glutamyl-Q tRNA(Asp) synthetase